MLSHLAVTRLVIEGEVGLQVGLFPWPGHAQTSLGHVFQKTEALLVWMGTVKVLASVLLTA